MDDDLEQMKMIFIEESFENLSLMEAALINVSPENYSLEDINTIFRGAHSLKGGSATFGFTQLSELTHDAESLLDTIRNKQRPLTQDIIELMLEIIDLVNSIFTNIKNNINDYAPLECQNIKNKIHQLLETPTATNEIVQNSQATSNNNTVSNKRSYRLDLSSIHVSTEKIDSLINLLGELVITQSILSQFSKENESEIDLKKLRQGIEQLTANSLELQRQILSIRMVPINHVFTRLPRLVKEISHKLHKKVDLKISGERTEIDKNYIDKIADPIQHLVRNALDHGIEPTVERVKKGKSEVGNLTINAFHQGSYINIEISDDGAGLNRKKILDKAVKIGLIKSNDTLTNDQLYALIFQPGFTTGDQVTDISGRGVGMDVVKNNIEQLGGIIGIKSADNVGTTFTLRSPLTLAILEAQLFRIGTQIFILPIISILESIQIKSRNIRRHRKSKCEYYQLRDEKIPIVRLYELYSIEPDSTDLSQGILIIVDNGKYKLGIFVDELLAQQQVVIKSIEDNYKRVPGLSAGTILWNGTVAFIIDLVAITRMANDKFDINDETEITS